MQGLTNPFDNEFSDKKAYGFVADDDLNDVTWWAPDGAYFVSEHPFDLVAEWVEPKRIRSR